ncbi:hypothetical protein L596_008563 [Steinernema carpocapsae]|uniref:Uncharacterized protein n=1 Tax=Steinernema carpocapsae TaxID=34508 RepID=A0A4U5PCY7_STECR|nr:hypothetical protein L596_008563 [Steinernema carpocapsae]
MFYRSAFRYGYGSKKNPEVHEIGGFEWIADESRECPQVDNKSFRCTILTCRPKNENKKTVLWSCLAKGIHVLGNMETNVEVAFHMWQNLFNNGCSTFHVHREQAKYSSAFDASCPVSYGEVQIEIVTSTCADLTDSNNPLIDEDRIGAAHFKVGDEHLWLSKRLIRLFF